MEKVAINVSYNGVDYTSDNTDFNEKEYKALTEFMEQVASGRVTYLTFKSLNKSYYFPANILNQSIISIVKA